MNDQYQKFGENKTIKNSLADPVQDCLAGNFFNGAENPLRYDIGRCNSFMGQRCANQWDGYCDLYLNDITKDQKIDYTYANVNKFLKDALDAQFCQVNNKIRGSDQTCYTRCEQMDPLAPDSAMVCQSWGDFVYRNSDKEYNIDTQFNALGKLSTATPIQIAKCPKICNLLDEEKLSDSNRVLNECLDRGIGTDILVNIVENAVSQKVKITNKRLLKFIDSFIVSGKYMLKPGYSSLGASPMLTTDERPMPAVYPTIKPNTNYLLTENANFGPQMVNADKYNSMTEEQELSSLQQPRFVEMEQKESEVEKKESFRYSSNGDSGSSSISVVSPIQKESFFTKNKTILLIALASILIATLIYIIFNMK